MLELQGAMTIAEIVVGAIVAMALGDYLGHKIGRSRMAIILGSTALAVFVLFWVYAAFLFATGK